MGPDPDWQSSDERTPLLESGMGKQSQVHPDRDYSHAATSVRESAGQVGFLSQVGLLLWKIFLLQKRSVKVSIAEILIPLIGAVVMLVVRQIVEVTDGVPTTWPPKDLGPSAAKTLSPRGVHILYAPNSTLIDTVMANVSSTVHQDGLNAGPIGFYSESDLVRFYQMNEEKSILFPISVIFDVNPRATTLPSHITYTIRPRVASDDRWQTHRKFSFYQVLSPREDQQQLYYNRSFLYLQRIVAEALIQTWQPDAQLNVSSWSLERIPFPKYIDDPMVQVLQLNFPTVLMLSFILSVIIMSKNIVYEKERQLKESMKLMGMSAAAHWMSWFLLFFIYLFLICAIYTIFMSIPVGDKKAVLAFSDSSVVFVFLLIYSVSIITYTFFISTLSSKANIGAALGGILFFAIFFPYYFLEQRYEDLSLNDKLAACILFNMAMSYGIKTVGLYEGTGKGAQWDSFTKPASVDDNFSLMHAMVMLAIDSAIFLVFAWYLDNVRPGTYGIPRPWYFPCQPSYWCGGGQKLNSPEDETDQRNSSRYFEREPVGLSAGIRMVHLRKQFATNQVAVKDSTLTMFEGQITVLLGHNGAGKTTTMSMLTGFLPPTSGTAYVNGYDIRTDINSVRSNLGLCPQHNILFDSLTVDEHLHFFARFKGCPKKEIDAAVAAMAEEVGLSTKRSAAAGTLSGGQKRKLSVGIALIGGSKIVILDEPTSGMDPAARRQTWDVLQRHRAGRTMLLSTHFMDEADLLGDRIAIMAEGVVKCCGTSMFLKKLYGAGYHLVIVKKPQCDISAVTDVVLREITGAQLESQIGAELSFLLPKNEVSKFEKLFRIIETERQNLGVTNFGITATTMEEVFLKVGENGTVDEENDTTYPFQASVGFGDSCTDGIPKLSPNFDSNVDGYVNSSYTIEVADDTTQNTNCIAAEIQINGVAVDRIVSPGEVINVSKEIATEALDHNYTPLSGFNLMWSRFWGMFVKKLIHTMRNRIISAVQLALPVIFTIVALTVDKTRPKNTSAPSLTLNLDMFDGTFSYVTAGTSPSFQSSALASNYTSLFSGDDIIKHIPQNVSISDFFLEQADKLGHYTYNQKVLIGAAFEPISQSAQVDATAWYSGQPYHAMPVSLAYLMNAFAAQLTGSSHSMTVINHPMPKEQVAAAQDAMKTALMLGFSIGFSMLFGMAFLTASFSYFLIRERQTGAKHLQMVSGVDPFAFWVSSLAWDLINYMIPCLVLLVVFAAFQVDAYVDDNNLGLVLLVLVMFGFSVIPFIYILQFLFITPATGFVVLIILAIITGLFTMLTVFIMQVPTLGVVDVARSLDWVFMALFPHYCMGMGFSNFYVNHMNMDFCINGVINFYELCPLFRELGVHSPCCKGLCENDEKCLPFETNYLAWDYPGIGRNIFFFCLQAVVFFGLTLAIDFHVPQKLAYLCYRRQSQSELADTRTDAEATGERSEDSDVAEEQQHVISGAASGEALVLSNLYKRYGNFLAVDHISVSVPEQECFGLLGQNGAGKTTTFKILTGDVMLTDGDAFVRQLSIKTDIKRVQANMGYCPQFDALIDQMTGRETLTMYARLRGIPSSRIEKIVNSLISFLMLEAHADKLTLYYSGGNKRKLSTAVALVGGPAIILLDEPSSGMDPGARRQLWNVLSQVRASGKTLILTSHSMEECDALCTRLAIMVNGQFKCLGSPQHLKSKFGQGYTLIVKMATDLNGQLASAEPLVNAILSKFPGTQKFDDHQGYVHFQVPDASIPLSQVFATMEKAKTELFVEDYSVHQTTLEQIFLTFTRTQYPPSEVQPSPVIDCIKSNLLCFC